MFTGPFKINQKIGPSVSPFTPHPPHPSPKKQITRRHSLKVGGPWLGVLYLCQKWAKTRPTFRFVLANKYKEWYSGSVTVWTFVNKNVPFSLWIKEHTVNMLGWHKPIKTLFVISETEVSDQTRTAKTFISTRVFVQIFYEGLRSTTKTREKGRGRVEGTQLMIKGQCRVWCLYIITTRSVAPLPLRKIIFDYLSSLSNLPELLYAFSLTQGPGQ